MNNNLSNCQALDAAGKPLRFPPEDLPIHERFKAWVELVFSSQSKFAHKVGYSRQHINEMCNGKEPIPASLLTVWELSEKLAFAKQEIAHLKRKLG